MLTTLAVAHYRSLRELVVPMTGLNLVTGANGSGKSNLYRALRLLAQTARGGVIPALAREGGPAAIVLREATRRAGVVPNAAYRHFRNHQERPPSLWPGQSGRNPSLRLPRDVRCGGNDGGR